MSAAAIIEAYKQQCLNDAEWMAPHYLTCLKHIAILRGGTDYDTIDQFVQAAYADGKYATEDVDCAFSYFGIDSRGTHITDDQILEIFYTYLGSPSQETIARRELWRLGDFRQSERLKAAAEDRMLSQLFWFQI